MPDFKEINAFIKWASEAGLDCGRHAPQFFADERTALCFAGWMASTDYHLTEEEEEESRRFEERSGVTTDGDR